MNKNVLLQEGLTLRDVEREQVDDSINCFPFLELSAFFFFAKVIAFKSQAGILNSKLSKIQGNDEMFDTNKKKIQSQS